MKAKSITLLVVIPAILLAGNVISQTDSSYNQRTPWGDPDISGMWSYASLTPLQRPERLGEKEFYTPEEAAQIFANTQQDVADRPGDVGSYNYQWFDRGEVSADFRTSLIVEPSNGRLPVNEATIASQRERAEYLREHSADSWLDRTNWDRCITYHGVPAVSSGYNNSYHIVQNQDFVAIHVEMIHDVRIIPIDGRPQLHDNIRQWNGDSRGYWDGDTLVVRTANYSDKTRHRFPSSRNTIAVERFRRVGEDMIDYSFTIEDPTVYDQSWTAVRPMPRLADYKQYEYACHEGNYAMTYILRGARAEEARALEQNSPEN
ncbi:MAG: hypothetical protein ACJZ8M_02790 [Pseudohongiellaceae bacterium]|nr:hypothetical protein [Gammaproteobacteria bacterium]|tara:strand:+ start:125 stop:1078 length:954 start_codon:yes stop_codon:yes gene_type:complete